MNGPNPTFSTVIGGGNKINSRPPTTDDFPALSTSAAATATAAATSTSKRLNNEITESATNGASREEILISNLLASSSLGSHSHYYGQKGGLGAGILKDGNMDFTNSRIDSSISGSSNAANTTASLNAANANSKKKQQTQQQQPIIQDQYGMLGMLDVVRMTNQDQSMLALGTDLTSLGLDLNGNENIYSTFMTPFSDTPNQISATTPPSEPLFTLHSTYTTLSPTPAMPRLKEFSDETMFYIFYAMPRDVLQEAAAQELYTRSWRFHKEFKLWLTKDAANPSPIQKGPDFERGVYVFFDPATWSRVKLERVLYFDHLEERSAWKAAEPSEQMQASTRLTGADPE